MPKLRSVEDKKSFRLANSLKSYGKQHKRPNRVKRVLSEFAKTEKEEQERCAKMAKTQRPASPQTLRITKANKVAINASGRIVLKKGEGKKKKEKKM